MITEEKRITYKYGDTFTLKPIADVHLGAVACDEKAFKDYLADSDDKTLFLGIGDLYDAIVVTDPRYQKSSDKSKGDAVIDEQVDRGVELLEPYKDKILGLGSGNHERTVLRRGGSDLTERTCRRLGVKNLGYSGLFKLIFRMEHGVGRSLIIRYHHGHGGGSRTQGADLTKFSKEAANWDADLFLYGHVHKLQSDKLPRLGMRGKSLVAKPKTMVICGTFLKTYMDGTDATYSEVCGYPPTSIGGVNIDITPESKGWITIETR